MKGKINLKQLAVSLLIPLAVGGISAFLTRDGMKEFQNIEQPPLSPPAWLFPIVWTILYLMMGTASYLVEESGEDVEEVKRAQRAYSVQLVFNFFWSLIFFGTKKYLLAFVWLLALLALILLTQRRYSAIDKRAGNLLIPYALWVAFAGYLNLGVYLLNR